MTPREASKDQHRLKEKMEQETIEKEVKTAEGTKIEENEKDVKKKMIETVVEQ